MTSRHERLSRLSYTHRWVSVAWKLDHFDLRLSFSSTEELDSGRAEGADEFQRKLAPSTQGEYRRILTKAETKFGDLRIAALEDWRVRRDFLDRTDEVARDSGLREADDRLSTISAMLTGDGDRLDAQCGPRAALKFDLTARTAIGIDDQQHGRPLSALPRQQPTRR
jgi:hypothetical protein